MIGREIRVMTYDDWETLNNNVIHSKRMNYIKANRRMALYYKRQRLMGYILIIIGLISVSIGNANSWDTLNILGIVTFGIGIFSLFTKRMLYIDKYYLECHDRLRNII